LLFASYENATAVCEKIIKDFDNSIPQQYDADVPGPGVPLGCRPAGAGSENSQL